MVPFDFFIYNCNPMFSSSCHNSQVALWLICFDLCLFGFAVDQPQDIKLYVYEYVYNLFFHRLTVISKLFYRLEPTIRDSASSQTTIFGGRKTYLPCLSKDLLTPSLLPSIVALLLEIVLPFPPLQNVSDWWFTVQISRSTDQSIWSFCLCIL